MKRDVDFFERRGMEIINMRDTLGALKIERDVLREQVRGREISHWKFWEYKQDNDLMRKSNRICEINTILMGARLQKEEEE